MWLLTEPWNWALYLIKNIDNQNAAILYFYIGLLINKLLVSSNTGIKLTKEIEPLCGPTLKEFREMVATNKEVQAKITVLREEVEAFASKFPLPGFQ